MDNLYDTDYSDKLVKIKVWGFNFLVTPRFVHLYASRLYEPVSSRVLLALTQNLPSNNLFLDIGAHYGYYALLIAAKTKVKHIIGIEPITENIKVFRKNIAINKFKQITVYESAISDRAGNREIRLAHASDSSSFAPHPTGHTLKTRVVPLTTIDAVSAGKTVGVIKLDVEGHEIPALQGAQRALTNNQPVVVFEYHPLSQRLAGHKDGDLLQRMLLYHYKLWAISEAQNGLVKLSTHPLSAHKEALKAFGHEGYGNILALPPKSTFIQQNSTFLSIEEISPYPIPGSGKNAISKNRLNDTGIGLVTGQEPKTDDWDKWWLIHERDFYKQEFERVDNEVRLFKQKWIYTMGQRFKGWITTK